MIARIALLATMLVAPGDGVDGEPDVLTDEELLLFCTLLVVAGNETTRNATSGGLLALIENPGELEKLRRDPALVPTAVEEIVRWVSPVVQFCRTAVEDVEVRGTREQGN